MPRRGNPSASNQPCVRERERDSILKRNDNNEITCLLFILFQVLISWAYMTISFIFTLVLFHGSSSLFSGPICIPKTSIFFHKKCLYELASQLMSSPHINANSFLKSSSVCVHPHWTRLSHPLGLASPLWVVKSRQIYDMEYPHRIWQGKHILGPPKGVALFLTRAWSQLGEVCSILP